jgi:hypothetical protein
MGYNITIENVVKWIGFLDAIEIRILHNIIFIYNSKFVCFNALNCSFGIEPNSEYWCPSCILCLDYVSQFQMLHFSKHKTQLGLSLVWWFKYLIDITKWFGRNVPDKESATSDWLLKRGAFHPVFCNLLTVNYWSSIFCLILPKLASSKLSEDRLKLWDWVWSLSAGQLNYLAFCMMMHKAKLLDRSVNNKLDTLV